MKEASYKIAFMLSKKRKPFSDGEEIVKLGLQIFAEYLNDGSIENKVSEISLSKQTITRHTEELSNDVAEQVKDLAKNCTFFC